MSNPLQDNGRREGIGNPIRVACVVGARPNFIKVAALIHEFRRRPHLRVTLIHTGQHSSAEMSQKFFDDLELPAPDLNLSVPVGTQTSQIAEIMLRLEPSWQSATPDILVVVGDVSSTLAASLVACRMGIPIAHVEAGLRSFDRRMPEEINRVLTDSISDLLFVTEESGRENLLREGVAQNKIHFVGNVMIDTLLRFRAKAQSSTVLQQRGLTERAYGIVTLHRPANVDDANRLRRLVAELSRAAQMLPMVFPVHPRTRARLLEGNIDTTSMLLTEPLGYIEFMRLMSGARMVLTDSGGIQEETTMLGVPCLTIRDNTERPVTIACGGNRLIGTQPEAIVPAIEKLLEQNVQPQIPEKWDGKAAGRIADVIEQFFAGAGRESPEAMHEVKPWRLGE